MGALDGPTRPSGSPGAGTSAGGMPGGAAGATAAAATAADSRPGLLLSIPAAVAGGRQKLLAEGPLAVLVVEASPPAAPATPTAPSEALPPGQLYPELYKGPSASAASVASSEGSEGSAGGGSSSVAAAEGTSIMLAVGDVSFEVLPASQTLEVGELSWVFSTHDPDVATGAAEGPFLAVTLAADTEAELVGVLEAVLESVSIYRRAACLAWLGMLESAALLSSPEAAEDEAALASRAYKSSLARGVHRATKSLAGGLLASAAYASGSISRGAAYLAPAQPTAAPVAISPGLKKRQVGMRSQFAQTARLAGYASRAVNSAVSGLAYVGAKVAGGVLWVAGADKPLKPGEEAGMLREVSQAAILGFTEVWDAMEEAGQVVLLSARDSTAGVVHQRYGPDAEEVSVHSMNAAGRTAEVAFAARKLGVRTVAKAAAKKTAKGVIHKWAGVEGASSGASLPGSRGSSRGGSADNLPAAAQVDTGAAGAGAAPAGAAGKAKLA